MIMIVPFSKDIRNEGGIGTDSKIAVTLEDVVGDIDILKNMKNDLIRLSRKLSEASLHILSSVENSNDGDFEGRGRYFNYNFDGMGLTIYSKGIGSIESIRNGNPGDFPAFGPINGKFLYDPGNRNKYFPRTLGTVYTDDCRLEFLNSLRILVDQVSSKSFPDLQSVLDAGISIPISVANFSGLGKHLKEKIQPELISKWRNQDMGIGSVTLVVPSNRRAKKIINNGYALFDKIKAYQCVSQALKELFLTSSAMYSPSSVHRGNIYFADSIVPSADNADITFTSDMDTKSRVQAYALCIHRMLPKSERFLKGLDKNNIYHAMFSTILGDPSSAFEYSSKYLRAPEDACVEIANIMEQRRNQPFSPNESLVSKIMDPKEYSRIVKKQDLNMKKISNIFRI